VIATRPEPGTLLARGSTVTLVVSSGPGQVVVPPVVGLTEAEARNNLASNNLQASVEYRDLQPGDPNDGRVISQSVAGGTSVDRDTTVALVVGRATAPVTTTSTTTTTTLPPETTVPATVTTVAPP
jgi:serine/threonine-protein kinase